MEKLKPIVSRHWLSALAGIMWTGVGLMLMWRAQGWLAAMERSWAWGLTLLGGIIAISFYYFMFTKTVTKNIRRLCSLPDPVGLLAFNSPKSYLLIVLMISMGIALRHSSLDRRILAAVYAGMGGALFLASLHFYRHFYEVKVLQKPCEPENRKG
jgi:hypothetical protein